MSFSTYPEYKDSGVDWLGDLPAAWSALRIRSLFQIKKRIVGILGPDVLSITQQGIKVKDTESNEGQLSMDYSKYQIVEPGDFAMNHMDLLTGFVDISPVFGVTSPDYRVFGSKDSVETFPRFFLYVFQNAYRNKIFYAYGQGSSHLGRWRLPTDAFLNFGLPVPPVAEQRTIAMFLEQETAKIDVLIEEQRRLIELLKEKRQAAISHAVRRGVGSPPTKASGVSWLGPVPAHWSVVPLKLAMAIPITDGPHETPVMLSEGVPFVSAEAVSSGQIDFRNIRGFISREDHASFAKKYLPRQGDVFMVKSGATTGVAAIVDTDAEFNIWSPLAAMRSNPELLKPEFLLAVLRSDYFQKGVQLNWSFGTQQNIGMGVIENLPIALPPIFEQGVILKELQRFDRLNEIEGHALRQITLLQERRSALIAAAVTGKIDVRDSVRKPVRSVMPYTSGFAHQLLAAKILSCCNDSHMGRVKLQKLIHVVEYHAQIEELRGNYTRKMAGPLDMTAIRGLEKGLEKLGWFKTIKETEHHRYRYVPLSKHEQHTKYLKQWADKQSRVDEVIALMGNMTMRQCEIVSTLYAAWNDLLIDQVPTTDEAILAQATTAEGWHESKERTSREKWNVALQWMKKKGLVPTGFGTHTRKAPADNVHEPA